MNRGALLGECEGSKASEDQCTVRHEEQAKHPTPHEFLPFLEEAWLRHRAVHVAKVREASLEEAGGGARSKCLSYAGRLVCRDSCVKVRPIIAQR